MGKATWEMGRSNDRRGATIPTARRSHLYLFMFPHSIRHRTIQLLFTSSLISMVPQKLNYRRAMVIVSAHVVCASARSITSAWFSGWDNRRTIWASRRASSSTPRPADGGQVGRRAAAAVPISPIISPGPPHTSVRPCLRPSALR